MNANLDVMIRQKNWLAIKKSFGPYAAVGAAIALLVPETLATSLPGVRELARGLSVFLPAISRFAVASDFPETTRFFMTVMWIGFPVVAFQISRTWTFPSKSLDGNFWEKTKFVGLSLLLLLPLGYLIVFFFDVSADHVREQGGRGGLMIWLMTQSRVGLAFFGCILFCFNAWLIGVPARFVYLCGSRQG